MEVSIGVQNVARDITIETDRPSEEVRAAVEQAVATGGVLALTDDKGKQVLVPGNVIGWVLIGEPEKARVGFGTA